jgi:hypothetical protein
VEKSKKKFRVDEMVTQLRVIKDQRMAEEKLCPMQFTASSWTGGGGGGQKGSDQSEEKSD